MRNEEIVLGQLTNWAKQNSLIQGMVLTSSRVIPGSVVDILSDYDIELYVSDLEAFAKDDEWLQFLGSILVRWPYKPRSTMHPSWITRLVLFDDGVRVDFQITSNLNVPKDRYLNGFKILVDKEHLFVGLEEPTYREFIVKRPTVQEYEELVHEFWWDATYVLKCLWRNELPFAKYMLDNALRYSFLHPIIEWHIGIKTNWSANPGLWGKKLKYYLDQETWWQLENTYAGAGLEENWDAFFSMLDLLSRLAQEVGAHLGLDYPHELESDVRRYCLEIRMN